MLFKRSFVKGIYDKKRAVRQNGDIRLGLLFSLTNGAPDNTIRIKRNTRKVI